MAQSLVTMKNCEQNCIRNHVKTYTKNRTYTARVMLISDEFNGQPPLSGHLPSPRGWPLNGGSELIQFFTPFKNSLKKILLKIFSCSGITMQ